ncbi:MAG TPA: amidohydrolase family protein [Planctomycetota bacterium]|nr:amidohydrolase family protein [Planctomycetota bacterium]
MGVIDFHMHFVGRVFFETLAAQSPLAGDVAARLAGVVERTGIELPDADVESHARRWLAEADAHGVERLCAFASVPEEIPSLARAAKASDGRIVPFALVNPTVDGVAEKVRGLIAEQGFGGVLLFPAMHHYHIGDERCAALLSVLNEAGAVCFVHCGVLVVKLRDLLGLPRPMDLAYANPLAIVPAANRNPHAHFVIPHFGAGFLREALMAGAQCANVHVDTSSSNGWRATQAEPISLAQVFERALGVFGPERILFGTDSNVFPAGWRADRLAEQRAALSEADADEADIALVLGGNAQRLLDGVRRGAAWSKS